MKAARVLAVLFVTSCATPERPIAEAAIPLETADASTPVRATATAIDAGVAVACTEGAIVFRGSKIILVVGEKERLLDPAHVVDEAIRVGKACPSTELYDDDPNLARAEKVHAEASARGGDPYVDHARELEPQGTRGFRPPTPTPVIESSAQLGSLAHVAAGFSFASQSLAHVKFRECEEILSCSTDASSPFFSNRASHLPDAAIVHAESVSFDQGALEIHLVAKNCDALDRFLTGPDGQVLPPPAPPPDCTVKTLRHARDWLVPIRKTDLPVVVDWDP